MSILKKVFGDPNKKAISKYSKIVAQINTLEKEISALSDVHLKAKTEEFRQKLKEGAHIDGLLIEAFAVVREAAKRTLGQRHYDVQLMAGMAMHDRSIAEMKTGEGKTLSATLALYLNALPGKGAHLVTVNDYLARRDAAWMGRIFHFLGMSTSCIQHEAAYIFDPEKKEEDENELSFKVDTENLRPISRQEAYDADILYGTNNEFGFDYLRDNMVQDADNKSQRPLYFAIIDEVDSILIDEARTPLIISAPSAGASEKYYKFAQIVATLKETEDYNVDEKMHAASLTQAGIDKVEKMLGQKDLYQEGGIQEIHHIEQALKAHTLFKKDKDYVVKDGEVIIVDEFTGRLMFGRRYSEGLHQAIEAKEALQIKQESLTLATITLQNFFRLYKKLAGMTGTAETEAEEFLKIYGLDVVVIPTNKQIIRNDRTDKIYKNEAAKFRAVIKDVKERYEKGQPVLIGTISIEKNELLSKMLEKEGVPHELLNAKNHEREAEIIAQAGKLGAVTLATNMAGRGVDIVFGGNPQNKEEAQKVREAGGLAVIGTERHESRRIDNQLRGRSGRQGDPGSSQFYVSMTDDLMRIFGSDRMQSIMERLGIPEDMPIENKMISRSIESAQKKVEGRNFDIRKHLVEYDDIMNKHREVIYKKRDEILEDAENNPTQLKDNVLNMVEQEIEQVVSFHTAGEGEEEKNTDIKEIIEVVGTIFPLSSEEKNLILEKDSDKKSKLNAAQARTDIIQELSDIAKKRYAEFEKKFENPETIRDIEKAVQLRAIDTLWVDHLDQMTRLREGIGLRGYGQRDPLVEYKKESFDMFTQLMGSIQNQVVHTIFKVAKRTLAPSPLNPQQPHIHLSAPAKEANGTTAQFADVKQDNPIAQHSENKAMQKQAAEGGKLKNDDGDKVGRNDPCPCGSGKKYKKCHGA